MTENTHKKIAVFGGGCFWRTEAIYQELKGVTKIIPGCAGGTTVNPTYEQVCAGTTGHAEAIRIEYDPDIISYEDLLTVFFATHDSTTLNRQGNDVGTQYRSAIFYADEAQRKAAAAFIKKLNESGEKVVTELKPFKTFYEAEDYHRQYYLKNFSAPYYQLVISPKLEQLKTRSYELLKESEK